MDMTLNSIAKQFSDEDKARELLEHLRWPDGKPICPHCGSVEKVYRIRTAEEDQAAVTPVG